jgi:hypothetical protein
VFRKPLGRRSFRDGSVVGGAFAHADHLSPNGTPVPDLTHEFTASTIERRFVAEAPALLSRLSKSSASESASLTISGKAGASTSPGTQAATLSIDTTSDHAIKAAESTRVDFTKAALGHAASGTIKSSLRASDGAGHATTANSVLLDTDNCLSPTLSGNVVNPTDVTHTISKNTISRKVA